jgi:type I restriction enzyme S subunit
VKDLFQSTASDDSAFAQLRDDPNLADQRKFINRLFNDKYEPYADKDFISRFSMECLSRFWELYLGCTLLDRGFQLVLRENLPKEGPDFCIEQNGSRLWIEAVVPTIGSGADSLPLKEEPPPDRFQIVPQDQIILRYCSAIKDKHCAHLRHLKNGVVKADDRFIIAINGAGIPIQFSDAGEVPYVIRAVLPFGQYSVIVDKATKQVVKAGFKHRNVIIKSSGSPVQTNIFLDCTFSFISGLLFANAHPFSAKTLEAASFSLLHHYSPLRPLPQGWFGCGIEWQLRIDGENYVLHPRRIASSFK